MEQEGEQNNEVSPAIRAPGHQTHILFSSNEQVKATGLSNKNKQKQTNNKKTMLQV